jgi:hypothetical protein
MKPDSRAALENQENRENVYLLSSAITFILKGEL